MDIAEDVKLDPEALLAGQRAGMVSNGCGCTEDGGEHVFCDDARLPDHVREPFCLCKEDAKAAIKAYLIASAIRSGETGK